MVEDMLMTGDKLVQNEVDVEKLVEEVLRDPSFDSSMTNCQYTNTTTSDNIIMIDEIFEQGQDTINMCNMADHEMEGSVGEELVDPYELLESLGPRAFIEEQREYLDDPREIYDVFDLTVPEGHDNDGLWLILEGAVEEIYIQLLEDSSSSSSSCDFETLDNVEAADSSDTADRVERAKVYLEELRVKGPLTFADDHQKAGTDAASFLADIGFALPRSMQYLDHDGQWSFIKRFLIKYVYQRPRIENLCTFDDAVECIRRAKNILVVTGAGISVSCGIPDFRSENGLYRMIRERFGLPEPECMFDIEYFRDDPAPFYMLAQELFPGKFKPSVSHYFIKALENSGRLLRNYTQNIDTLEQVAGIDRAVYCHGSFASATCIGCKSKWTVDELKSLMDDSPKDNIPYCPECGEGVVKPDIVFFGEPLPSEFDAALEADIEHADLVLVIGSSMKVQPVSMIPDLICPSVPQILINRERLDHYFDMELIGDADVVLGEIARRLSLNVTPYDCSSAEEPAQQFVAPNMTLFAGCSVGGRPPIPDADLLDGSLLTQALSPAQQDPAILDLVKEIFPKPE